MQEPITQKHFQTPTPEPELKIVQFVNFSDTPFTWTLNKVPWTFQPGEPKFMEESIANHFAKHLVNRELLKMGRENDTSPKKPSENPFFMELFKKCITPVDTGNGPMDKTKMEQEAIDRNMKAQMGSNLSNSLKSPEPEFEELLSPDDGEEDE